MDAEFYDTWHAWAFMSPLQRNEVYRHHPVRLSPYAALASILARTPSLQTLRLRFAESRGPRSAWHRFATTRAIAAPFGVGLENAYAQRNRLAHRFSFSAIRLPALTQLELDGFEDIEPLLVLTPNLEVLRMSLSAGFPQSASIDLIDALIRVPKLRELAFTPEALHVAGLDTSAEGEHHTSKPINMIEVIGRSLPNLEVLDLRAYWHSDDVHYLQSLEYLNSEVSSIIFMCCLDPTKIDSDLSGLDQISSTSDKASHSCTPHVYHDREGNDYSSSPASWPPTI